MRSKSRVVVHTLGLADWASKRGSNTFQPRAAEIPPKNIESCLRDSNNHDFDNDILALPRTSKHYSKNDQETLCEMAEILDSMIEGALGVLRTAGHEGEFTFFGRSSCRMSERARGTVVDREAEGYSSVESASRKSSVVRCWCSGRITRHVKVGFDSRHVTS